MMPAHWDVCRNGRLFTQRNESGFGDLSILEVSLKTCVRLRDMDNFKSKQVMSNRLDEQLAEPTGGDVNRLVADAERLVPHYHGYGRTLRSQAKFWLLGKAPSTAGSSECDHHGGLQDRHPA